MEFYSLRHRTKLQDRVKRLRKRQREEEIHGIFSAPLTSQLFYTCLQIDALNEHIAEVFKGEEK